MQVLKSFDKLGIKKMKGIKSQGHVEVIISFVLFIGFLLFIFVFLNPFARTEEPSYIMDNAQKAIMSSITDKVGKLSVILSESGTCYNFDETDYGSKYREVSESNAKYTIYFNDIFFIYAPKKQIVCDNKNYTLGVYSEEKMGVYDKITDLKEDYNNYEALKNSLGITNDFLFSVSDLTGAKIEALSASRTVPGGVNVESRDIPMRVINNNGQIQELILNIRVW
jgi:hypothetical protein